MPTDAYLLYAIAGGVAGLIRDILRTGGLILPQCQRTSDGATLLRLGFITSIVVGIAAGVAADHHWVTAAVAGWAGPDVIESLVNSKAARLRIQSAVSDSDIPPGALGKCGFTPPKEK